MTPGEGGPRKPPQALRCAACGREETELAAHFCRACGAPLAVNRTWLLRANLDFLLGEVRDWQAARRLPEPELGRLLQEYAARRAALDNTAGDAPGPVAQAPPEQPAVEPAAAIPPPEHPAPGAPAPATAAGPAAPLAAFLEEHNIAALHVVGSLLLVAGLVALVRWQWATFGRGIVLALLLALTAGLYLGGRRLSERQPASGLVLVALAALIAPLNVVAANLFHVFGPVLSWDGVGLVTALPCAGLYAAELRRTRHPLFATLFVAAGAGAALFAARLLLPGHAHLTYAAALVPTSALYFAAAHRLRGSGQGDGRVAVPFLAAAHGLVFLTALLTLAHWPSLWAHTPRTTALLAAVIAALYGVVALLLRLPALAYVAACAAVLAGQLLLPGDATGYDRAVAAALVAGLLAAAGVLHRRLAGEAAEDAAGAYHRAALATSAAACLPFLAAITAGYVALRPVTETRLLGEGIVSFLVAAALFAIGARRGQTPAFAYVALAAGAFARAGLLSLFFGAARPGMPAADHALLAALGGALLALGGGLAAVWPRLRRALSLDAAVLAAVATLPLLPFVTGTTRPLATAGILCLLALAWAAAAAGRNAPALLYPAAAAALLALRLAAGPLNAWGVRGHGWEPNETRWLLLLVPASLLLGYALRSRLARPDLARPVYHAALAAALWAGIGQVGLILGGGARIAASPALTLWLLAAGLGIYGAVAQRLPFVTASLVPAALGYLAFTLLSVRPAPGALSAWIAAAALAVFGVCYLWVAWEHGRSSYAYAGGLSLFAAYVHTLARVLSDGVLPGGYPAWALCLVPCFALFFVLGQLAARDSGGHLALRRPLHGLALGLSVVGLALFLADLSGGASPSLAAARAWLLATLLVYAALYAGAAFLRDSTVCLHFGVAAATLGAVLYGGGYPRWETPLAVCGFWLALAACLWLGFAALLALARRFAFAEAFTQATLVVATLGVVTALLGVTEPGQGRWTVFALLVAGTVYGAVGVLRQSAAGAHAAFAAYFGAFALFLYDYAGLSLGTADFYLIPAGLYLIAVGWLVARARPDAGGREAAHRLYASGLFIALAPTFLAAWLDTAWWHSFLLVGECVAAVYFGIARRIRVFLGVGTAFLLALLGVKLYAPLRQVNFGIYLTLLGAAVLASAVFFDKRKGDVLRWARAARTALENWQ